MKLHIPFVALVLCSFLAACASGPAKRIHPSTANIQQLSLQPDGQWRIDLRIQNFSTVPMRYGSVKATLKIDGADVGEIALDPAVDVVANGAEVVSTTLKASAKLPSGDFAYTLKGRIETSEPKHGFDFERSSRLSPVPGVADTWR